MSYSMRGDAFDDMICGFSIDCDSDSGGEVRSVVQGTCPLCPRQRHLQRVPML